MISQARAARRSSGSFRRPNDEGPSSRDSLWRHSMGIPVRTLPRNIVVCCDGTDNEVATDTTNVLRLFRMLECDQPQLAYYDGGVGTLVDPAAISVVAEVFQPAARCGDRLARSRKRDRRLPFPRPDLPTRRPDLPVRIQPGAYTVRAVAGLIHFLGLLRPELENLATLAWAMYANEANVYQVSQCFAGGNRFNRSFGVTPKPPIHFVGTWDTVSSFGWFWNFRTLPYTAANPSITHFRHALAIDERRACFPANLYFPEGSKRRIASRSGSPASTPTWAAATRKKRRRSRRCRWPG